MSETPRVGDNLESSGRFSKGSNIKFGSYGVLGSECIGDGYGVQGNLHRVYEVVQILPRGLRTGWEGCSEG